MHFLRIQNTSSVHFSAAVGGVCLLFLSGCAHRNEAAPTPSESELCGSLQGVIAEAAARFQKFKTTRTISPFSGMTKWETKPVFFDSQCDVLEWVGGRTNYVCTWPEGTEAQARETYQKTAELMGRCLTQPWSKSETRGQTGGATTFKQPGNSTQVVMRYFRPRGGFGPAWETSLTIGDEVTPEPR